MCFNDSRLRDSASLCAISSLEPNGRKPFSNQLPRIPIFITRLLEKIPYRLYTKRSADNQQRSVPSSHMPVSECYPDKDPNHLP